MKLYIDQMPKNQRIILAGDHTAYPRRYAKTLKDRTFEHGAKVISGKPITLRRESKLTGQNISQLYRSQFKENKLINSAYG
jgi:hypothetical protein